MNKGYRVQLDLSERKVSGVRKVKLDPGVSVVYWVSKDFLDQRVHKVHKVNKVCSANKVHQDLQAQSDLREFKEKLDRKVK